MSPVHSAQTVRSRSARLGPSSSRSARSGRSSTDYMRTALPRLSQPVRQQCCWRAVLKWYSQLPRSVTPSYGNKSRSKRLATRVVMVVSCLYMVCARSEKFHNSHNFVRASIFVCARSPFFHRVPGGIRTPNLLIRSQKLYPVELQALLRKTIAERSAQSQNDVDGCWFID